MGLIGAPQINYSAGSGRARCKCRVKGVTLSCENALGAALFSNSGNAKTSRNSRSSGKAAGIPRTGAEGTKIRADLEEHAVRRGKRNAAADCLLPRGSHVHLNAFLVSDSCPRDMPVGKSRYRIPV